MNYHKELKDLISLRDSESISKDEFDRRRKRLFNSKNKLDEAKDKLLNEFRVDFSKSDTTLDSCKIYVIYPKSNTGIFFEAENCSKTVVFKRLKL